MADHHAGRRAIDVTRPADRRHRLPRAAEPRRGRKSPTPVGALPKCAQRGISTFDNAHQQIEEAEQEAPDLLIIDLTELQFVDSTGVWLILAADQRARQVGRRLGLRLGAGPALRVFAALGLTDRFDLLDGEPNGASPGPTRA